MTSDSGAAGVRKQRGSLELRFVLDTNQLFTGSASDLLRAELSRVIEDSRKHKDVRVMWYLPEIVRLERRFQMLGAGRDLLPAAAKLERLLGHGLAITEDILADRVNAAIDRQIATLGLNLIALDTASVDWPRLIGDSADRRAPFVAGKHERGFRDALVAETFFQLVAASPRSPERCRVILVTGDETLAGAVAQRSAEMAQVKIVKSLDALQDLINVVVADVTEAFINRLRDAATTCFFVKDDPNSLYYASDVGKAISKTYSHELSAVPEGAVVRKNGTWYVGPARFGRKKGQRVHWVTTIRVETIAYRQEYGPSLSSIVSTGPSATGEGNFVLGSGKGLIRTVTGKVYTGQPEQTSPGEAKFGDVWRTAIGENTLWLPQVQDIEVARGQSVFEVDWSVTVTATRKLINPRVDKLRFADTTWGGKAPA